MQQRGVIITAVILALILAGVLWYSLSQPSNEAVPIPTPSPSTSIEQFSPLPVSELAPSPLIDGSVSHEPVAPSAPSGTAEYVLGGLLVATLAGGVGLTKFARA